MAQLLVQNVPTRDVPLKSRGYIRAIPDSDVFGTAEGLSAYVTEIRCSSCHVALSVSIFSLPPAVEGSL